MKNKLKLSLGFLRRDWRTGEVNLLAAALIIAVASTTTISLFADRLHRTMELRAAEFLAADLVLTSHSHMSNEWIEKARELRLDFAQTAEFASVLLNGDRLLLSGVKACTDEYPLRGSLKTTTREITDEVETREIPVPGTAWVDNRVLERLGLSIGDSVEVGETKLRITRIVTYEPDRRGNFLSISPRVLINYQDLAATRVIQPGSHVHYYYLFAGQQSPLAEFSRWVKPKLNPTERIIDVHQERPEIGSALSRAERFLGLGSIVVVVIAGVAIAMATRRYSERHFNVSAMLRCLGLKQNDILLLYLTQMIVVGVLSSLIGYVIGWGVQEALLYLLRDLLPKNLAGPGWYAVILGISTGLLILAGFALPPILRLRRVSALTVFRRDLLPLPPSVFVIYGLAFSTVFILIWRYTDDLRMTSYVVAIGSAAMLLLSGVILILLKAGRWLIPRLGLGWRFGLRNLCKNPKASISQILGFSITLTAMVLILLIRTDLIESWQTQLPDQAPNHFALNVFPSDVESFKNQLDQEAIRFSAFYPIIRGRLVAINRIDLQEIAKPGSYGERATNRTLSMTEAESVPEHNQIERGEWRAAGQSAQVSVESQLAESLGIDIGDRLTFGIGSEWFTVPVTSIRKVQWDAMKPTFYMMFSPGTLEGYPRTYLTSFFLASENRLALNRLVKRFPAVAILEVDMIIGQFKAIIEQVSISVEFILAFAVLAGFTVLFAAVRSSIDERIFEGALLRTLGANRALLRTSRIVEFCGMGFLAGLLAATTAELLTWVLYTRTFDMAYGFTPWVWLITPVIGAISIGSAGYLSTRVVLNNSPMTVFREL